jgi:hypothetical protein
MNNIKRNIIMTPRKELPEKNQKGLSKERKVELTEDNKKELPKDALLSIFSFLNVRDITQAAPVAQQWNIASKGNNETWLSSLKPEYHQKLAESKLSPKTFYLRNIDARLDTFYLVANRKAVQENCKDLTRFNAQLAEQKEFAVFSNKKDAIEYADSISVEMDDGFPAKPGEKLKQYPSIITMQVKNRDEMEPKDYPVRSFWTNQTKTLNGFSIDLQRIKNIYEISYKAGKIIPGQLPPDCRLFNIKISSQDSEKLLKGTFENVKGWFPSLRNRR